MMEIRIASRRGTGLDGFPTTIYVLTDRKGEDLVSGYWYSLAEAEAERDRLQGWSSKDSSS
jgi:hypothetical protein